MANPPLSDRRPWGGRWRTFESYGNSRFRLHQASWATSSMAMQMAQLARPWLAFELSDSALMLGLVAGSQGLAQVIAAPFGGLAADRMPKRTVLLLSQLALLAMVSVMAALVAFDIVEVWHLALLAMVHGVAVTFNNPVRQAFIPLLLPRRLLGNGIALHSGIRSLNQIIGPAIVGVLLEIEVAVAFFVIVGLHMVSVTFSTRLPHGLPEPRENRSIGSELIYGLRYVAAHKVLRVIALLSICATILVHPYPTLLPVFQKNVLVMGESALGFMFASIGLGALVASVAIATFSGGATKSRSQLLAGIAFGVAVIGLALAPVFPLTLVSLFAAGASAQVFSVANSTQMMHHADPALYGRVSALNIWIRALMFISLLGYGALVDLFGAPATVATGGAVFIACVIGITVAFPRFRRGGVSSELH